ncbi:MAG: hypothetical protein Q9162_006508 [Coniocarpon cinnabarinum]
MYGTSWWDICLSAALAVILAGLLAQLLKRVDVSSNISQGTEDAQELSASSSVCLNLAAALPHATFSSSQTEFQKSIKSHWSQQAREDVPLCIVKPRNAPEVSAAVSILRREFDRQANEGSADEPVRFAVRSGGHSPEVGFSTIKNGIVLDLSLLNEVTVSEDKTSTVLGSGAKWGDVSSKLDSLNLAVAGGRNSNVGVGGLLLGGGISFYSPQVGFACSNIIEYEIVLSDGSISRASASENSDLWKALKGGSSNFGIVTRFIVNTFPAPKVWGGYLYAIPSKAPQFVEAVHKLAAVTPYDEHAAGPMMAFGYVSALRCSAIGAYIIYAKPQKWPSCYNAFTSIGRLWSTVKVRTLTDATNEQNAVAPSGLRQFWMTTTVKNDLETLHGAYNIYRDSIDAIRYVKGITYNFVFQVLRHETIAKGTANSLGLSDRKESLIIVLMTLSWKLQKDDVLVESTSRKVIDDINELAESRNTSDPWRYLNYCATGQKPLDSYGEETKQFLQSVSRRYDPERFFQTANAGGFKLFP